MGLEKKIQTNKMDDDWDDEISCETDLRELFPSTVPKNWEPSMDWSKEDSNKLLLSLCKKYGWDITKDDIEDDMWRFITFTTDPKKCKTEWDDRYWEEKIRTLLCRKTKLECVKFIAGIEHHKDGRKHCHVLAQFEKDHISKNGLNNYMFKRYWKSGNVDVRKVNLKRNKNSILDCINYIKKEDYYTFNYEWDMITY